MTLQQLVESRFVVGGAAVVVAVIAVSNVVVVVLASVLELALLVEEGVVVKPLPRPPRELWPPTWVLHWGDFWHFPAPEHHKMLCV